MSYYILRPSEFNKASSTQRIIYFLKKKDVPADEREDIVHLKCASIKRVSTISDALAYLQMNTSDASYTVQPYILKRIKWNEAVDKFGLDYDTDTSGSESDSSSDSSSNQKRSDNSRDSSIVFHPAIINTKVE